MADNNFHKLALNESFERVAKVAEERAAFNEAMDNLIAQDADLIDINNKDSAVLLPCPFCGCTNVYPVGPSLGHSSWRMFCDDCHAEGPQIPSFNSDEGEARCQWVWQIRYPAQSDAEIIAENKRLREALVQIGYDFSSGYLAVEIARAALGDTK